MRSRKEIYFRSLLTLSLALLFPVIMAAQSEDAARSAESPRNRSVKQRLEKILQHLATDSSRTGRATVARAGRPSLARRCCENLPAPTAPVAGRADGCREICLWQDGSGYRRYSNRGRCRRFSELAARPVSPSRTPTIPIRSRFISPIRTERFSRAWIMPRERSPLPFSWPISMATTIWT